MDSSGYISIANDGKISLLKVMNKELTKEEQEELHRRQKQEEWERKQK